MAIGDTEAVKRLEESYLQEATKSLVYDHRMSLALFGHDIPYILLMHVGALDAKLLPRLVEMYRQHGITFVSLQEASQDPFYRNDLDLSFSPHPDSLEEAMSLKGLPLPRREHAAIDLSTLCSAKPSSRR